ncbi:MAG: hypothetical protein LUH45_05575, partial [Clostridiales bacterium]|nr:hypothetical protein [Clostridiales bacterium]
SSLWIFFLLLQFHFTMRLLIFFAICPTIRSPFLLLYRHGERTGQRKPHKQHFFIFSPFFSFFSLFLKKGRRACARRFFFAAYLEIFTFFLLLQAE